MGARDIAVGVILAVVAFQGVEYWREMQRKAMVGRLTTRQDEANVKKLQNHNKVFKVKEVNQVTPNIHIAIGFALANSMMIEGKDGIIIVDVTESTLAGKEVLEAFRNITKKPIKGIIYTHNHGDHTYGARAFIEDPKNMPEIWAHADLVVHLQRHMYTNPTLLARATRQFGVLIPQHINSGIGPSLRIGTDATDLGIVFPTKLMTGVERDISIAGVDLKLVHIPGETEDQIGVYVPSDKAFLCADDVYQAFPNLYAIRGTPTRDVLHWSSSLDRMINLKPEFLVPSHTRPIVGRETIRELLTGYRDAIQFVHDQTLRYMNKGFLPDEIVAVLKLPEHLAAHPYLQEFYGTVEWSSKGVFNAYMGWFSGDPVDLSPLTPNEMATRMVQFGGGENKVTTLAKEALSKGEWQWALVLSSYVMRVNKKNQRAQEVKVQALMKLGDLQTSANGRNYYFTTALEEVGEANVRVGPTKKTAYIRQVPMLSLFKTFQVRWNAEECGVINATLLFKFKDTKEVITMTTRNSVVLVSDREEPGVKADVIVVTSDPVWRETVISKMAAASNYASGELDITGDLNLLKKIMGCIDSD